MYVSFRESQRARCSPGFLQGRPDSVVSVWLQDRRQAGFKGEGVEDWPSLHSSLGLMYRVPDHVSIATPGPCPIPAPVRSALNGQVEKTG